MDSETAAMSYPTMYYRPWEVLVVARWCENPGVSVERQKFESWGAEQKAGLTRVTQYYSVGAVARDGYAFSDCSIRSEACADWGNLMNINGAATSNMGKNCRAVIFTAAEFQLGLDQLHKLSLARAEERYTPVITAVIRRCLTSIRNPERYLRFINRFIKLTREKTDPSTCQKQYPPAPFVRVDATVSSRVEEAVAAK